MDAAMEDFAEISNPLDLVEDLVSANEWPFDRHGAHELSVCISGSWCDYNLGFSYAEDEGTLQVVCAYDVRVPEHKRVALHPLLALVNERMLLGHFDLWSDEGIPMFRHAVLLRGGPTPSPRQMEGLIDIAVRECERFYPAFQFVIWGGRSAADAVEAAMLETVGEA
jgi:hypothetical protein